jgi:hypothetical protein
VNNDIARTETAESGGIRHARPPRSVANVYYFFVRDNAMSVMDRSGGAAEASRKPVTPFPPRLPVRPVHTVAVRAAG